MALILLIIGAALFFSGRLNLGPFNTSGKHVRAAGLVLMLPMGAIFVLSLFLGMMFGDNIDAAANALAVFYLIEVGVMTVSVLVAYILLANPENAPRLPGILGDIQDESRDEPRTNSLMPRTSVPRKPSAARLPSVYNVHEAARYLGVSDSDVLRLIETGKLPAARINYDYKIAKSVLDEFRHQRQVA
jgi:excisionase family DNA binding protein